MIQLPEPLLRLFGIVDRTFPSTSSMDTGFSISFRYCLLLCVPAILIGGWLRFEVLRSLPVIYYGPDGNSYFHTVGEFWTRGVFDITEKRRWLYPVLLIPLPLSPFSPAATLAWIQHLTGLLVVVPLGWIVGHVTRFRSVWIPVVTIFYSMWPQSLWMEHEMQAEAVFLAAFITTTALAFPLRRLACKNGIFSYLACAAAVSILKTLGKPIWAVFVGILLLFNRRPFKWGLRNGILLAVTVLLVATSGSDRQGGWLFLSSTLPFLPPDGTWPEYRKILQPWVEEARADLPNYAFRQCNYKLGMSEKDDDGPLGPAWAAMVRDRKKFEVVMKSLAMSAFLNNPPGCARLSFEKIFVAAWNSRVPNGNFESREFHRSQVEYNAPRWKKRPKELEMLNRMPQGEAEKFTASFPPENPRVIALFKWLNSFFAWGIARQGAPGIPPEFGLRWPGWLAVLGLVFCLLPGRFFPCLVVWLPSLAYMAACFSVGDAVGRYLQPIEWTGMVLAAVALDVALLNSIRILKGRKG